jgi:solute carrier family 25 (mitochondrial carnitine/acylcarnitine transporter), member 20/29
MSADFWAGYVSGAIGIIIGNPLDLIKVRLQARDAIAAQNAATYARQFERTSTLFTGTAAPILGYGALNALLFVSYNRTEAALNRTFSVKDSLWTTWFAGAVGGLATWVVSTPTELVKCRAQMSSPPMSSWLITKKIWRQQQGIKGLYFGGVVTALRDSIGYGFYFWSYQLSSRLLTQETESESGFPQEAAKVLLCGGLAGIVTWASIFPLDVIKTRVQTQPEIGVHETTRLLRQTPGRAPERKPVGAIQMAREAYREGGIKVFFRGITVCSVRAFVVNAAQWAVYEWMMHELGQGRGGQRQTALPEPM